MTRDEVNTWLEDNFESVIEDEDIILFDGLEDAFMGLAERFEPIVTEDGDKGGTHRHFAVYDYDKIVEGLVADGMDVDDAREHIEFNVIGAYVGESTPAILYRMEGT